MPPLLGAVADMHNSTALAMVVPLAFFIAAWSYAFCVNFVPSYVGPADKLGQSNLGLQGNPRDEGSSSPEGDSEKAGIERAEDRVVEMHEPTKI